MIYYVIYTIDKIGSVRYEIPTSMRHLLEITESYTDKETGEKHRKLCGWLTQKQFNRFISDTDIVAQKTETMGNLTEYGLMSAICFNQDSRFEVISKMAYVTPVPQKYKHNFVKRQPMQIKTEKQWQRLRKAVIRRYK